MPGACRRRQSTSAAVDEVTGIFDGTTELQKNWLDPVVNLSHYTCGSDEYGVKAAKYGHKPLYVKTAGGLNEVFCYIVSKLEALRPKIQGGG